MSDAETFGWTWGRHLLVIVLLGCVIAVGSLAYTVWERIQALDSARTDHTDWAFTQLEIEFLKTERSLAQAWSGTPEALEEFRKRFDILYSRVLLAERARHSKGAQPLIQQLKTVLDNLLPLIDGSNQTLTNGLDGIHASLRDVDGIPREIALSSIAADAQSSQEERRQIVRLIEIMSGIAAIATLALVVAAYRVSRQTNRLNRASRLAEENRQRLATTLRASLDAIVVIGEDGRIKDFNGSAEEVFGIARNDAVGRDYVSLIIPPPLREEQRRNIERFRLSGEAFFVDKGRQEYDMIDQDGRVFPVELSISITPSSEGRLFIAYIRDITRKRQRVAEIIKARDEALHAYEEKSRFFAMMSHEMRTPLNGVLSALQLLDDERLDGEQKRYLNAATTSGEILLSHINDVLAIERSEAGGCEQVQQVCDISSLTAGIIATMEPLARTTGTSLRLEQAGLTSKSIVTDPRAIQQVLVNLLSNAIKFSPEGHVTLRAWFAPHRSKVGTEEIWLQVEDNGPGIPSEDINRIFEDFVSLDSRYERRTGGTGLGLGIVRRLVRGLGGEVTCTSVLGEGTRFSLRLPAVAATEDGAKPEPIPTIVDEQDDRLKLLVVDDNKINRDLIEAMLKRIGHDVTLAMGGHEAVEMANQSKFDAILMDISMPGMNGKQATQAIFSGDGPNASTPVIAVTAHAMPKEREEFNRVGMTGFLQKPLDMKALRSCLAEVPRHAETLGTQSALGTSPASKEDVEHPLLNEQQVDELLDLLGDEKLGERFNVLTEEVERELEMLITSHAVEDLQSRSHAMAGMCGMLGAERMHCVLKDIEVACKTGDENRARRLLDTVPEAWDATHAAWRARIGL